MADNLLIINDYPRIGGAEKVLLQLCRYLSDLPRKDAWNLHVVTSRSGPLAEAFDALGGIDVDFVDIQGLKSRWLNPGAWRLIRRDLARLLERFQPAVIICNSLWAAIVIRRVTRGEMPVICAVHADVAPKKLGKKLVFNFAGSILTRGIAGWITVSDSLTAQLRRLKIPADRIRTIPNGVLIPDSQDVMRTGRWRNRLGISPECVVAAAMGRIDAGKGQHVLVEAVIRLLKQNMDVCLIITGEEAGSNDSGPVYTRILLKMIDAAGMRSRIFLTGFIDDPAELIRECDLVASASRQESFGLAVLEGMAAGRAVVASRVEGHCRLVKHEFNGLLVDVDDVDGFHSALKKVATDRNLRMQLGREARRTAQAFDLNQTLALWAEYLRYVARSGSDADNADNADDVDDAVEVDDVDGADDTANEANEDVDEVAGDRGVG